MPDSPSRTKQSDSLLKREGDAATSVDNSLFCPRKLDGVTTTEGRPGAVTLLTPTGGKVTANLTDDEVQRFAALIAECVRGES